MITITGDQLVYFFLNMIRIPHLSHAVFASVCFSLLLYFNGFAQKPFDGANYANSWVNPSQSYVRISVVTKGLQSVSFSELQTAGLSIQNPERFELVHRGKKVPIISISNNLVVFYGEPNDGGSDSLLYRPRAARANPYSSLFSDKGAYFLTAAAETIPLAEKLNEPLNGVTEPYHLQTDVVKFADEYSQSTLRFIPIPFQSYFENQEGWTSVPIRRDGHLTYAIELKNRHTDLSIDPVLEVLVNGRQNSINHNIAVSVGMDSTKMTLTSTMTYAGISGKKVSVPFKNSLLNGAGQGYLRIKSNVSDSLERNSVTYYSVTYPQQFIVPGGGSYYFNLPGGAASGWSRVKINNANTNSRVFDVTDSDSPKELTSNWTGGILEVMVKRSLGKSAKLFVAAGINTAEKVTSVTMKDIDAEKYDYFIISNSTLLDAVNAGYKPYRESEVGGGHRVLVMSIQNIYDQFNYGEVSPVGIRRFVDFMLSKGRANKYLLLIGTSITVPENLVKDLPNEIPTVGFPGSDALLVEGLAGVPTNALSIPVGRIPVRTVQELNSYLQKVVTYESTEGDNSWKKNVMHMSGGKSTSELSQLKSALAYLVPIAESGHSGAKVLTVSKRTTESVEPVNVSTEVNSGLGMITYFGHGSPTVTDLDMGYISAPERGYSNSDKYSFMYFNGCGVGNIFTGSTNLTLATDWLLSGGKGAIAVLANSYFSYYSPTNKYLRQLYDEMFVKESSSQLTIGEIMVNVTAKIANEGPNIYDVANIHQSLFMGDPALHIIQPGKPDYSYNTPKGLFLKSADSDNTKIGQSSSLKVGVIVTNGGSYNKSGQVDLQVDTFYDDIEGDSHNFKIPAVAYRDTVYLTIPNKNILSGIQVKIDPENLIEESDEENNEATLTINWSNAKEQLIYWGEEVLDNVPPRITVQFDNRTIRKNEIVRPDPVISILLEDDNLLISDSTLVDVLLKPCDDWGTCNFTRLNYDSNQLKMSSVSGKAVEVVFTPTRLEPGSYELFINARDISGNPLSQSYRIGFVVSDDFRPLKVVNSPNPATAGYVRFESEAYNSSSPLKRIENTIYTLSGVMIEKQEVANVQQGNNEWYWFPIVPSGLYFYKVVTTREDGSQDVATGKINLVR